MNRKNFEKLPEQSTDCMDLTLVAVQMRHNSERWFPELHESSARELQVHYALGLAGEVGEIANLTKKFNRYGRCVSESDEIGAELADAFTYLMLLANECHVDLIAEASKKAYINESRWGLNGNES